MITRSGTCYRKILPYFGDYFCITLNLVSFLCLFIFQIIHYLIVGSIVLEIEFENFFQKNHCKIDKKMQFFLALWVITFLPPEHNAKNPNPLEALVSVTLFFE